MARDPRDDGELTDEQMLEDERDAARHEVEQRERRAGLRPRRTSPLLFLRQVVAELRKVVWPTKNQLITYSLVVVVFVAIVMGFVFLLDLGFGKLALLVFT
jgi:preprotein translocase subunit SecE